jgi:hypothetical protein
MRGSRSAVRNAFISERKRLSGWRGQPEGPAVRALQVRDRRHQDARVVAEAGFPAGATVGRPRGRRSGCHQFRIAIDEEQP